jgi:hypothetical protein
MLTIDEKRAIRLASSVINAESMIDAATRRSSRLIAERMIRPRDFSAYCPANRQYFPLSQPIRRFWRQTGWKLFWLALGLAAWAFVIWGIWRLI